MPTGKPTLKKNVWFNPLGRKPRWWDVHGVTDLAKFTKEGRKHGALRPQKPLRLIRDGEIGGSGILYLTPTLYTVTTRMTLH